MIPVVIAVETEVEGKLMPMEFLALPEGRGDEVRLFEATDDDCVSMLVVGCVSVDGCCVVGSVVV